MVEIFREDFETGTTTMTVPELTSGCTAEITNVNPINGVYSGKFYVFSQVAWTEAYFRQTITGIPQVYVEALVRIDAFIPEATSSILRGLIDVAGERMIAYVGIDNARHLTLIYRIVGGALLSKVSAVTLEVGVPYKIRLEASAGSSASFRVFLNDVEVTDLATTDIDNTDAGLISKIDCGVHNAYRVEATVLVDDILVSDTPLPIVSHHLSVDSTPITGVPFTINDLQQTTPYSADPEEGVYTIVMPSQVVVGADTYNFVRWEDGSTNATRTITLTADLALTTSYELALTHTLTIDSSPIQGVPFTIEKVS